MINKILKFLFPIPTIVITVIFFIIGVLSVGLVGSLAVTVFCFSHGSRAGPLHHASKRELLLHKKQDSYADFKD